MFLVYIFALVCSASLCGMESNLKEAEDELRREWGEKLYCPINDYLDKELSPKLQKRSDCLQSMLASEEHRKIKEKLAEEIIGHYRRLATCLQGIDKNTADIIRSLFSIESSK